MLPAPYFTYPEELEGGVNPPAPGVELGPYRMRGGDDSRSATQTVLRGGASLALRRSFMRLGDPLRVFSLLS